MFDKIVIPISNPARTRRGARPDKKRHPRSSSSADVIVEGLCMNTQSHITTSSVICKPKCREKVQPIALTVKLGLGLLQWAWALLARSPTAGAVDETAPVPQRCVIMDSLSSHLIFGKENP
jgi:hypothetical protein